MNLFKLLLNIVNILNVSAYQKLAMYWQIDKPIIQLSEIPIWVDNIIVSFATIQPDSTINFPINDIALSNSIKTLQSKNQTVTLSVGGAYNCGPLGISQDKMFGFQNFNPVVWANSLTNFVNMYNFDGVDIDYECRDGILQNPVNVANALNQLRVFLPNLHISFVAFSVVAFPSNWQNYLKAFVSVKNYVNTVLWASYNINLNQQTANSWYANANLTQITQNGYNRTDVFYGYCLGSGCVYGPGPSESQIISWAFDVKQNGGGGLFLWDITGELSTLNNNITAFNTISLSKKIADILHS